jgi:uncharacterized protein (TIGR02246 family)
MTDAAKFHQIAADYAAALSSGDPKAVASFYAADGKITINRGDDFKGTAAIEEMAAEFFAEIPDLNVYCDTARISGTHAIFAWTLEGHHAETKNHVKVGGWEEWELDREMKVKISLGWFDSEEYDRQITDASGTRVRSALGQ